MDNSNQERDEIEIPIDMESHLFGLDNTWVVIGLPDTEDQYTESGLRKGFGSKPILWRDYIETVVFVDRDFPLGHPLHGAKKVIPIVDEPARADAYPCYGLRRRQIDNLRVLGLKVTFGATRENFMRSADQAFACGGLLSVMTHYEESRGFEFTDGFLSIDEIPASRTPSGRGLLDAAACQTGKLSARRIKLAFGPATWVYLPTVKLSASASLLHRTEVWTSIVEQPKIFLEHLKFAYKRLKDMGIETGVGRSDKSPRREESGENA